MHAAPFSVVLSSGFAKYLCSMISLLSSFAVTEFSSTIPDLEIAVSTEKVKVEVAVAKAGESTVVFSETLYPDMIHHVRLSDIDRLIEPYSARWLVFTLQIRIIEPGAKSNSFDAADAVERLLETRVVTCKANILNMSAEEWCEKRFLTLIDGEKTTAPGFLEYLYFVGRLSASPTYRAYYDDGSTHVGPLQFTSMGDDYGRIDASPVNFHRSGVTLLRYEVRAGERVQQFVVDNDVETEVAPVLLFWNSFGVQELAYCTGELKQVASFDRKQARIGRLKETYSMEEREHFKADTGYLSFPMANWWREVLRSRNIQVLTVVEGGVDLGSAKPVVITAEKHEMSNAADHLPRVTFEYEYADRNHNVFDTRREGRIFDDTFDHTFN